MSSDHCSLGFRTQFLDLSIIYFIYISIPLDANAECTG